MDNTRTDRYVWIVVCIGLVGLAPAASAAEGDCSFRNDGTIINVGGNIGNSCTYNSAEQNNYFQYCDQRTGAGAGAVDTGVGAGGSEDETKAGAGASAHCNQKGGDEEADE